MGSRADFQTLQSFFRLAHGFLYLRRVQQLPAMMRHIEQRHIAAERRQFVIERTETFVEVHALQRVFHRAQRGLQLFCVKIQE